MTTKIQTQRRRIEKQLAKYYNLLSELKDNCPHERLYGKCGANTGNWSSTDDYYWVELRCLDCGKFWTEDQDVCGWNRYLQCDATKEGFKYKSVKYGEKLPDLE